jgi:poly-D-alanine transfer protein DltD
MAANEEEIKIRERLVSLETKLDFLSGLLQEIRDELKDAPTKEDYEKLNSRVTRLEQIQNNYTIKVGIASAILGMIGGLLIKLLLK